MNEMRQTAWSREHRKKPYVTAVILAVLIVTEIFILSGILGYLFGTAGVVLHEIVLALIGVLMILIMRGRMKTAFPFRKLKWSGIFGSLILWGGILLLTSVVTLTMAYFFPDQMLNASNGVDELMSATPMWIDLLVVAVTPAICEEIAFRGALLTCFRGGAEQMDWDYYRRIILWCMPWQCVAYGANGDSWTCYGICSV